ncbi:UDP-glycosyltransferase 88F3 [Euphorbia peplus]|nr:UDP-glycosyltransferase 88F3 [Euphorbia peplus]
MGEAIVLCPFPSIGHIVSIVELSKLILLHYENHFSIDILVTSCEFLDSPSVSSYISTISQSYPSISFCHLPTVSIDSNPPRSFAAMAFESVALQKPYALESLQQILKTRNICAFIIDLFCPFALSLGKQLEVPTYYFFTSGAACLGAYMYFPSIHAQYSKSLKQLKDTVIDFPCMPPLKAIHMPEPFLDRDDPVYDYFVGACSSLLKADGIIVNTFHDLEPKAIEKIASGLCVLGDAKTPLTFYIGPVIAPERKSELPRHECLLWLDGQPRKSVVFLCFGSRGTFSLNQVREMADGLEKSGQRFLWVVKNPPDTGDVDLETLLPQGFLERVKDRGLIVKSWAPQIAVLGHDSVGGFVTHCGWNSVLEAVVAGVPLIAWPLYAEQHLNRNVLVEDMEMAIPVEQRDEDRFVSAAELERRVRELMESEKGKELKEKCWKMRESNMNALTKSGSSISDLSKLVEKWKQSS